MEILEYSQAWSQSSQEKMEEDLRSADRVKWAEVALNNPYDLEDTGNLDDFIDWGGGGLEAADGLQV